MLCLTRLTSLTLVTAFLCGCSHWRMGARALTSVARNTKRLPHRIAQPVRPDARLAALWVGHATILLQLDDRFILTDPIFTPTVAHVSRRWVEPGIDPVNLPVVDAVLISHMHFDHLSLPSLDQIEGKVRQAIVPQGGLVYVPNYDFPARDLPLWSTWEASGLRVTAVPATHTGWRYGADAAWMKTSYCGYIIEYHGMTVYFAGDTAYQQAHFRQIGRHFPAIDLALLPIAPVGGRAFFRAVHEDPDEAVQAFLDLRAKTMMPIHFDTFSMGTDDLGYAEEVLRSVMHNRGLGRQQVAILKVGEQRVFIGQSTAAQ